MSTTEQPPQYPVTQEEIDSTIWTILEAGASKDMATDYMMNLNLSIPVFGPDGYPMSVPMDETYATAFVNHIDALRKHHVRHAAVMKVIKGAAGTALAVGAILSFIWVDTHLITLHERLLYFLLFLSLSGLITAGWFLITALFRLFKTIKQ